MSTAQKALHRILDEHPMLTCVGFDNPGYMDGAGRNAGLTAHEYFDLRRSQAYGSVEAPGSSVAKDALQQFGLAILFLHPHSKIKSFNRATNTYDIKHMAERFPGATGYYPDNGSYVSNGMLIAAALALGFKAEPTRAGSHYAHLNISMIGLTQVWHANYNKVLKMYDRNADVETILSLHK